MYKFGDFIQGPWLRDPQCNAPDIPHLHGPAPDTNFEYIQFTDAFFVALHNSLIFMFIYHSYKYIVLKLITLQVNCIQVNIILILPSVQTKPPLHTLYNGYITDGKIKIILLVNANRMLKYKLYTGHKLIFLELC
jgi:hypothetical protein